MSSPLRSFVVVFLLLIFSFDLTPLLIPVAGDTEESRQFVQLLREAETTRRVHLISEHNRAGRRLEIDEFIDLHTWNQFIQFKWSEHSGLSGQPDFKNKKVSFIILNENSDQGKIIIRYEPYKCQVSVHKNEEANLERQDWRKWLAESLAENQNDPYLNTIESILLPAKNNPYMASVGNKTNWIFGISGLWLAAQFSETPPKSLSHLENGKRVLDSTGWRIELPASDSLLIYYFDQDLMEISDTGTGERASLNMIELRNLQQPRVIDLINLIDVDFNFSERLAQNLFKLPIGFNCPSNPTIPADVVRRMSRELPHYDNLLSRLLEFEVVARRSNEAVDVKTVTLATSHHPVDSESPLVMIKVTEDQYVTVRDFRAKLRYTMEFSKMANVRHTCDIQRLRASDFKHRQATDPVELNFSNGIQVQLNELLLDYILNSQDQNKRNYLNHIITNTLNGTRHEYVFESTIDRSHEHLLSIADSKGRQLNRQMSIVHVYEQLFDQNSIGGQLNLKRVIMVVLDENRKEKLAEVRFNLIDWVQPLSLRQKAQLFDLSRCFRRDAESIELVASYPIEEAHLQDYVRLEGADLLEAFYRITLAGSNGEDKSNGSKIESSKRRVIASFNFLRVPKVSSGLTLDGELELRLLLLDKPSPIHAFERILQSTFTLNPETDESFQVDSLEVCSEYCEAFNCQMLAFDSSSNECNLSPLSIHFNHNEEDDWDSEVPLEMFPEILLSNKSTLFYNPDRQTLEEASLVELLSYLSHYTEELDNSDARIKRGIDDDPLLSFDVQARRSEFAPPISHRLIPSTIKLVRVPLVLDVSRRANKFQLAKSFRTRWVGKRYRLNALDNWDQDPKSLIMSDERTYVDKNRQSYYTLRRLHRLKLETCQQMCLDIHELDFVRNSEQLCESFSYCNFEMQCILAVRTDFKYTKSILEIEDSGGARPHNIGSLQELLYDDDTCIVDERRYLSDFNGPLKLPVNVFGENSTIRLKETLRSLEVELNWVTLPPEATMGSFREYCALQCATMNHQGDRKCLALDHCRSKLHLDEPEGTMRSESCHILLVSAEMDGQLWLRIRGELSSFSANQASGGSMEPNLEANNCDRYMLSHLMEYRHIGQLKLTDTARDQLQVAAQASLSLESCAFECSIRGRAGSCQAFEYCSSLNDKNQLERNCTLIQGSTRVVSSVGKEPEPKNRIVSTQFSRDCHVYLGNVKSIGELFEGRTVISNGLNQTLLIVSFLALYLTAGSLIFMYLKRSKQYNSEFQQQQISVGPKNNIELREAKDWLPEAPE